MSKEIRARITDDLKEAAKAKDSARLGTLRLINAAIKDQEIALRAEGREVGEAEILAILGKMVKQRQESVRAYEEGGRMELAAREQEEITVISSYLPAQLSQEEVAKAIDSAISETGAASIRDMGRVIGVLKSKYTGQMDFGIAGPLVKEKLGS